MNSHNMRPNVMIVVACIAVIATALVCTGCDEVEKNEQRCGRELRRENVLRMIECVYDAAVVVHSDRYVVDLRLFELYTNVERSIGNEIGTYDTVWDPKEQRTYAYVWYHLNLGGRRLVFNVAWRAEDADTSHAVYIIVESKAIYGNKNRKARVITTVTTNMTSRERVQLLVGKPIDTLRQQRGAVEISYKVLGHEPFNFFRKIRVNGKAIEDYAPITHIPL